MFDFLGVGQMTETHTERVGFLLNFLESEVHITDFLQFFVVVGDLLGEEGNVTYCFIVFELLGRYLFLYLEYLSLEFLHSILPIF